jgi:diphthine-ammonia ligase
MEIAALFSGGKDSVMAVWDSIRNGHNVKYLITMISENPESYMFHYPNVECTSQQAASMGIPHIFMNTKGEKEKELEDLRKAVARVRDEVSCLAAGGLASNYQRNRIRAIADAFGLKMLAPFWNMGSSDYWDLILSSGFKVIITGVACEGLGKEWLGRVIDRDSLKELKKLAVKHGFHLAGEGGEFETFVLDGPIFSKRLEVKASETVWDRDSGFYLIKKIRTADKG